MEVMELGEAAFKSRLQRARLAVRGACAPLHAEAKAGVVDAVIE